MEKQSKSQTGIYCPACLSLPVRNEFGQLVHRGEVCVQGNTAELLGQIEAIDKMLTAGLKVSSVGLPSVVLP